MVRHNHPTCRTLPLLIVVTPLTTVTRSWCLIGLSVMIWGSQLSSITTSGMTNKFCMVAQPAIGLYCSQNSLLARFHVNDQRIGFALRLRAVSQTINSVVSVHSSAMR